MREKIHIALDVSNFTRVSATSRFARLEALIAEVELALDGRDHHLQIFEDTTFRNRFPEHERSKLDRFLIGRHSVRAPSGTKADDLILPWARARARSIVMSSDGFTEYDEHKEWLYQPGRLVGGGFTEYDSRWILVERSMRKNKPRPNGPRVGDGSRRPFDVLLDDLFPTVRSVSRRSGVPAGALLRLMTGQSHDMTETAILSETEAETATSLARRLRARPCFLVQTADAAEISEDDLAEWVKVLGVEADSVGGEVLISADDEARLLSVVQTPNMSLDVYRVLDMARRHETAALKEFLRTALDEVTRPARILAECWADALDADSQFDAERILLLPAHLRSELVEYLLLERGAAGDLPAELLSGLSDESLFLVECARFVAGVDHKSLLRVLDSAELIVDDSGAVPVTARQSVSFRAMTNVLSDVEIVGKLGLTKSQSSKISKRFGKLFPGTEVPHLLSFVSDGIVTLGRSDLSARLRTTLWARHLGNLGINWIHPTRVGRWCPTEAEISTMRAGDLTPLLSHPEVVDATLANLDKIVRDPSPVSEFAVICAAAKVTSDLENSLVEVIDRMGPKNEQ